MIRTVLLTISVILLLEGFFIILFYERIRKGLRNALKSKTFLKKIAILEIIIGLLVIGFLFFS